jgi:hypothetical protein
MKYCYGAKKPIKDRFSLQIEKIKQTGRSVNIGMHAVMRNKMIAEFKREILNF